MVGKGCIFICSSWSRLSFSCAAPLAGFHSLDLLGKTSFFKFRRKVLPLLAYFLCSSNFAGVPSSLQSAAVFPFVLSFQFPLSFTWGFPSLSVSQLVKQ